MPESGRGGKDAAEEAGRRLGDDMRDADGGIRIDDIYIEPPPPPALTFETDGPRYGLEYTTFNCFRKSLIWCARKAKQLPLAKQGPRYLASSVYQSLSRLL